MAAPCSACSAQAEILNYGSLGTTPLLLGATLAVGAAAALGITLVTSVRRRRHDLAILKTLGFTRGQLALAVAVPGERRSRRRVHRRDPRRDRPGPRSCGTSSRPDINAVPAPTVPGGTVLVVGVLALALAILVAMIPGRLAARTTTSQLLRAE